MWQSCGGKSLLLPFCCIDNRVISILFLCSLWWRLWSPVVWEMTLNLVGMRPNSLCLLFRLAWDWDRELLLWEGHIILKGEGEAERGLGTFTPPARACKKRLSPDSNNVQHTAGYHVLKRGKWRITCAWHQMRGLQLFMKHYSLVIGHHFSLLHMCTLHQQLAHWLPACAVTSRPSAASASSAPLSPVTSILGPMFPPQSGYSWDALIYWGTSGIIKWLHFTRQWAVPCKKYICNIKHEMSAQELVVAE